MADNHQEAFRMRLEREKKRIGIANMASRDRRSGLAVFEGEVLEIIEELSEETSLLRVRTADGDKGTIERSIIDEKTSNQPQKSSSSSSFVYQGGTTFKVAGNCICQQNSAPVGITRQEVDKNDAIGRPKTLSAGSSLDFQEKHRKRLEPNEQLRFLELLERTSADNIRKVKLSHEARNANEITVYVSEIVELLGTSSAGGDGMSHVRAADGATSGYVPSVNLSPIATTTTTRTLLPSRRKNNYFDIRKIGHGSFGQATLATRKTDGCQVVIKQIEMDGENDERMCAEAVILATHPHECIVKYMGSFEENGFLYIETEYCSEGNLRDAIELKKKEKKYFDEQQIKKWTRQLCSALNHLHSFSIIHRDVKAENVFVTKDFDAKLGDFGAAADLKKSLELLKASTFIGTYPYMAPELLSDGTDMLSYDSKVDIWSVGVLVYFLAALFLPFGDHQLQIYQHIFQKARPPNLPKSFSRCLVRFVDKLLTYEPTQRPNITAVLQSEFLR